MAIIYSYPTVTPASGDLIVGTDITGKVTKNFTVGSIVSTEIPTYITGTTNTIPLFTAANTIGNSIITQNTSKIGIGTATPGSKLDVVDTRTSLSGATSESLVNAVSNTINLAHTADAPAVRCRAAVSELINSSSFSSFVNTASRSTAKATGSGDIAALYGASNWSIVEGTGNYTYSIGGLNLSRIDNPSATVANAAGTHTEVQLAQGTVGNIDVFSFDFDQDAGTTITGDFNYIKIKDETPINISGTARALNIESTLPSYFAGNLGIGTGTPSSKLDVNGDITASKLISSANSAMFVEPSATSYFNHLKVDSILGSTLSSGVYGWQFEYDTPHASSVTFRFDNDNYKIYSGAGGGEIARFTDIGNVGIGTTSPNNKLEVAGNIRITESNYLNFGGTGSIPEWSIRAYNPGLQSNDLVIEDVATTTAAVKFENGKGVVLPNKTTTEINAINSPDEGAMVYNTTLNTICFYNGSAWQKVSHTAM